MNAAILVIVVIALFALAYRFYSRFLSSKVFDLNETVPTPAVSQKDDSDFVPTPASVLWGHHFSSIAGAAPIVGPAVAVIWGWLPALIWIVVGTIFMGAAHDFGALVLSLRHKGQSLASLSGQLISPRVRNLYMIVILFLVWMVIAVFALVIATLFIQFPSSVLPVNFQIIVALAIGYFWNRKGKPLLPVAILTQICLFFMIYLGGQFPIQLDTITSNPLMLWIVFLLVYSFVASTLPVWALLQPRDYINSHQLIIGLIAIVLGIFFLQPKVVAPVFQANPPGAPNWFPFLFITIACGAISGFHGLVSAGTTSKQVAKWKDSRPIGYGAMLGEGSLALLATLAVSAGFASQQEWHHHFSSWGAAKGLTPSITAFVLGSARFLKGVGLPEEFAQTMMSVMIISFAATSLDTATRIQRYIINEIGEVTQIKALKSPSMGAGLAVFSAFLLMLVEKGGQGGLVLWPLFGAANQMLAALTLILVCAYLNKTKKSMAPYLVPFCFVFVVTLLGLAINIINFFAAGLYLLTLLAAVLLIVEIWIAIEAILLIKKKI